MQWFVFHTPDHRTVLANLSALDLSISFQTLNDSNQSIGPELIADADSIYDDIFAEVVENVIGRMN